MEWIYPEGIKEEDILQYQGFVYIITNKITNKKYIGKKFVYSHRTKIIKGKKKKIKYISDWLTYEGSCVELTKDIELIGSNNFTKEIISVHKTRSETNYKEAEEQFVRDVLKSKNKTDYNYYNANILNKFFRRNFK